MAIAFARVSVHSRSAGHSAVAGAAYRAAENLHDERLGVTNRYTHRSDEVGHSEILLPADADEALKDRATFWNAVEAREDRSNRRASAQVAKDHVIALPREVSREDHVKMAREFANEMFVSKGVPLDLAVHYHSDGNPHAHLYSPTRTLEGSEFGKKARELNGNFAKGFKVRDDERLADHWKEFQNRYFEREGIDLAVTPRAEGLEATPHMGAAGKIEKNGEVTNLGQHRRDVEARNRARLIKKPELLLEMVTERRSVFQAKDLEKIAASYLGEGGDVQQLAKQALAHKSVVRLEDHAGEKGRGKFTTKDMVKLEATMVQRSLRMSTPAGHAAGIKDVRAALADKPFLSEEQRHAVSHVTGKGRISVVSGLAGAGKSTMLDTARDAWERSGYEVKGAALAGIAAQGLTESAGIQARTLHSWEMSWKNERDLLSKGDVFVIDEAGMVGSKQLARVLETVDKAGAKAVLVGDSEQLQPIEAGAPFRAIAEHTGYVEMTGVRRQEQTWQRRATRLLATGRTNVALEAYSRRGHMQMFGQREEAIEQIAKDYLADKASASKVVLAHSNEAVNDLNRTIRQGRVQLKELGEERSYQSERGKRAFAIGDRILFRQNDKQLGVKNGSLGRVTEIGEGSLSAQLDSGERLRIDPAEYRNFDHGYAMTIHKSQGATVDRSFVLGTGGMDRHLTYVAMSRHRHRADLYVAKHTFHKGAVMSRLSRAALSETTLDYLDRRGFETMAARLREAAAWVSAQKERLASLWERAEKAVAPMKESGMIKESGATATMERPATSARAFDLPPYQSKDGRDSMGRGTDPASVKKAIDESPALKSSRVSLERFAKNTYRDPVSAVSKIDGWIEQHGYAKTASTVAKFPERVGDLRCDRGMLVGSKAREERQIAMNGARGMADTVRNMERSAAQVAADHVKIVERQHKIDATSVPSLSEGVRNHLREIRSAQVEGPEAIAKAYESLKQDARSMTEIKAYQDAARIRLGSRNYQSAVRGTQVRVPGTDTRQLAVVSRTLQTVQQAQETARQVQQLAQGNKPKLTR
ncbi:Ti-type conjugative transfer relaxase TraA [Pelagibius sp. Alg239-R121]|uniref:Ti-type conjugative transfer relaxase TraA n=1 Tax=Pelagibius sp. Alg239-R121 TaxID=2993448 RepID=UPI0024A78B73|nr:Ti-type conjugative transfer relaxase TraA [Pelagibius sp. Alg239-R121]